MIAQRKVVVVFGATSAIAHAASRVFAQEGAALHLVSRDAKRLEGLAADLSARGAASVTFEEGDVGHPEAAAALTKAALSKYPEIDILLLAHGALSDQSAAQNDWHVVEEAFAINFMSHVAILTPIAQAMETRRRGTIAVIGSVAGDRGRQSNYVYGSAKAALATFTAGLRNRLQPSGVAVVTIKPGFTSSPMTAHLKQGPLYASAEIVGKGVHAAILRKRDVAYLPSFWLVIMTIIKLIPEAVFKRLKL